MGGREAKACKYSSAFKRALSERVPVLQDRDARKRNSSREAVDLRNLVKNALNPIEKKLRCIYTASKERSEKQISTSNLVQILIQEATDGANLVRWKKQDQV